jgi:hypothetical protein
MDALSMLVGIAAGRNRGAVLKEREKENFVSCLSLHAVAAKTVRLDYPYSVSDVDLLLISWKTSAEPAVHLRLLAQIDETAKPSVDMHSLSGRCSEEIFSVLLAETSVPFRLRKLATA